MDNANNITAGTQEGDSSLIVKQVTFGRSTESKREKRCSGDQDASVHASSSQTLNTSGREALDSIFNLGRG